MVLAVFSLFLFSFFTPFLCRVFQKKSGWLFSLLPLSLTLYFLSQTSLILQGQTLTHTFEWVPLLNFSFSFHLDGLSYLFAMLICGIGTVIVFYSGSYLEGDRYLGRFFCSLFVFMGSMLGVVLSNNVLVLFVFWELTSLSSYFLIGYNHEKKESRYAALQALLVTGLGGLALLVAVLMAGSAVGSFEITVWVERWQTLISSPYISAIVILVLLAAFTKSAQFPFHFWLPNAMQAPTPVSAYLHSSTMVKAGIYLVARLNPVFSETPLWFTTIEIAGLTTMIVGAVLSFTQNQYKLVLAYMTVTALGMILFLLGMGTAYSVAAALVFILVHALYKAALFLIAGAVDHETGEKDLRKLSGLRSKMPLTAIIALVCGLSMAGVPPLFGFIGKELFLESTLKTQLFYPLNIWVVSFTSLFIVCAACFTGLKPFFGKLAVTPKKPHEAPLALYLGPLIFAVLSVGFGLYPKVLDSFVTASVHTLVRSSSDHVHLALWHGFNQAFFISMTVLAVGVAFYLLRDVSLKLFKPLAIFKSLGPEKAYQIFLKILNSVAKTQTLILQNGFLRYYVFFIILTAVFLCGWVVFLHQETLQMTFNFSDIKFHEFLLVLLIIAATLASTVLRSRISAIISLGVVGYGVSVIFVIFGAPDLAMTQIVIETLIVVLFILVFYHLKPFQNLSSKGSKLRDALLALSAGALMTFLVLAAQDVQYAESISPYFEQNSWLLAHGRNVVNVILVDFRALDTLGEITVLAIAGLGIFILLKLKLGKK